MAVTIKDIAKKEKESERLEETMARLAVETEILRSQLGTLTKDEAQEEQNNLKLRHELDKQNEAKEAALSFINYIKFYLPFIE